MEEEKKQDSIEHVARDMFGYISDGYHPKAHTLGSLARRLSDLGGKTCGTCSYCRDKYHVSGLAKTAADVVDGGRIAFCVSRDTILCTSEPACDSHHFREPKPYEINLAEIKKDVEVASWDDLLEASREPGDMRGRPCVIGIDFASTGDMGAIGK